MPQHIESECPGRQDAHIRSEPAETLSSNRMVSANSVPSSTARNRTRASRNIERTPDARRQRRAPPPHRGFSPVIRHQSISDRPSIAVRRPRNVRFRSQKNDINQLDRRPLLSEISSAPTNLVAVSDRRALLEFPAQCARLQTHADAGIASTSRNVSSMMAASECGMLGVEQDFDDRHCECERDADADWNIHIDVSSRNARKQRRKNGWPA